MTTICYKMMQVLMTIAEPPETTELQTFARVVEARSISRAARELGVPRPTIGRRLARLEQKLGVRLLRRTTRAMALTDAGELFYARARAVLAAVDEAAEAVRRRDDAVRGTLRVATPVLVTTSFASMVADFAMRFPDVRIELRASSEYVDLVAGGYDVAIRAASDLAPGLVARRLSRSRLVAVASPAYIAAHGAPKRRKDLAEHTSLAGFEHGQHPATHWPLMRGGRVRIEPVLSSNDLAILHEAARRGRGIALLPLAFVYDDIRAGALVPVLPERVGADSVVAIVYADREFVTPALRAFIDAVIAWAANDPAFARKLPECDATAHGASEARRSRSRAAVSARR
jgi:DNA-binding transcriptional LysR family regulator